MNPKNVSVMISPDFTNNIITPSDLPKIDPDSFNPVDKKYLTLIYIRILISLVFMASMLIGLILIADEEFPSLLFWITGALFLAIIIYSFIITKLSFPYRGYLIREKDIAYQRGLISYKLTSIPYKRIQHVELSQGPIAKRMKLGGIKVFTAGGSSDDLSIPGLPIETAKEIRAFLTEIISNNE